MEVNSDECAQFAFEKKVYVLWAYETSIPNVDGFFLYCYWATLMVDEYIWCVKSQHLHKTTTCINWIICVTLYSLIDAVYHINVIHWFTWFFFLYPPLWMNLLVFFFVCLGISSSMNQRFNKLVSISYSQVQYTEQFNLHNILSSVNLTAFQCTSHIELLFIV